jgi:acetyl-CoA acetyltransferase
MPTEEAVIVAGARTAIGTAYKGTLTETDAMTLGTAAVAEAVRRSGIPPELFDDVILGESLYGGGDIARYAAIEAGLVNAPGVAHNRHCASGLATLQSAAASVMAGMDRVVVAGGVQSSSTAPVARGDVDLWEINEAFASVPIAACRQLGIDGEIVNVLGSGCSLGHPVAMTGTRMALTLVHELRRRGGGTAVAAMCAGGGMASALLLEV